jgi:hypothetical protein
MFGGMGFCMNESEAPGTPGSAAERRRKARLAEELRANLARRKAQARSRRTGGADERPEGLATAGRNAAGNDNTPSGKQGDG